MMVRVALRFVGAAGSLRSARRLPISAAYGAGFPGVPSVTLNDGTRHPMLGFGTYKVGYIPASASASVAGSEPAGGTQRTARECVGEALAVG